VKLIEDWRKGWQLRSVQVAGIGGALALGLAASSAVVPWLSLLPVWAVFSGGAVVCALTVWARLAKQRARPASWNKHGEQSRWR
jgi:hypothetical protein